MNSHQTDRRTDKLTSIQKVMKMISSLPWCCIHPHTLNVPPGVGYNDIMNSICFASTAVIIKKYQLEDLSAMT